METSSSSSSLSSSSATSVPTEFGTGSVEFVKPSSSSASAEPSHDPAPFGNAQDAEGPGNTEPNILDIDNGNPTIAEISEEEVKEVKRIDGIEPVDQSGKTRLTLEDGSFVDVGQDYILDHTHERGGFFVRFSDTHSSYYPAGKFESGHELQPLPATGELSPATPHPDIPPTHSHLECRAMIMEEMKRLGDLLNKSGAITAAELAESKFKHIIARYL